MVEAPEKKRSLKPLILMLIAVIAVVGVLVYFGWPYLSLFDSPAKTRALIENAGVWGPLVFIALQIVQVFIAPIPGQVVGLIGGYLFGPLLGVLYTMIGASIGFSIIFITVRKLGRPFVEHFVKPEKLDKFDNLTNKKGPMVFFFIFLLPAFPDDIISFVAGLTKIRIRTLIMISLLGRLPGYLILSIIGNGLTNTNLNPVIVGITVLLMLLAIAWNRKDWLKEFVVNEDRISFIKTEFKRSKWIIAAYFFGITIFALALYFLGNTLYP